MLRMLLLEQDKSSATYATLHDNGVLTVENRYLNDDGTLDFSHSVGILPEGVKMLLKLLTIEAGHDSETKTPPFAVR